MTSRLQPNSTLRTDTLLVDVTVDDDDGTFLMVTATSDDESLGDQDVVDLYTSDPEEIEQFFADVARAKDAWDWLRKAKP